TAQGLPADLAGKADEYLPLVEEAIASHDEDWTVSDETGFGWYICPRGTPLVYDGSDLPHNQYLALAVVQSHLYGATGNPLYQDRVRKMLGNFASDLHDNGSGGLWWPYWWLEGNFGRGYTLEDDISDFNPAMAGVLRIEDISHALFAVWAAIQGKQRGWVFTDTHLTKMANTFMDKVAICAADSADGLTTTAQ